MRIGSLFIATSLLLGAGAVANAVAGSPANALADAARGPAVSPYVDMGLWPTPDLSAIATATGVSAVTAAFIVADRASDCSPTWAGYTEYTIGGDQDFHADISAFQAAGGTVTASFGGVANDEIARVCTDPDALLAAYSTVVSRFSLNHLDFDIEGADVSDSVSNVRRAAAVATLQKQRQAAGRPLSVTLTLPAMPFGLLDNGLRTIAEFNAAGVVISAVNLMAMDYGTGVADMGQAAVDAAQAAAAQLVDLPAYSTWTPAQRLSLIGLTPMLGVNDTGEIFTVADATTVGRWAEAQDLAGIGWWELTRDQPCTAGIPAYMCSGVDEPQWAFSRAFVSAASPTTVATDRVSGSDRFGTAIEVSRQAYPAGAKIAFIANGLGFPDALSAGPLAAASGGPVLLTAPDALPAGLADEITRLAPDRLVIVGGPSAVSDAVETRLGALVPDTTRIGGTDRFETSRMIADRFGDQAGGPVPQAFLATGSNFPDALAAAAAIGSTGPVILINGAAPTLDTPTATLLTTLGIGKAWIAGGPNAVSTGIEHAITGIAPTGRFPGTDRYDTAQKINAQFFHTAPRVLLATGSNFPDALAGSAWAPGIHAPLYLTQPGCVPQGVLNAIGTLGASRATLLGGTAVLTPDIMTLTPCT